jgi:type II secretory pathway component PulF
VQGALAAFRSLDDGQHRAEFYRMWALGLEAGFAHPKSLETMGPRPSPDTERVCTWLLEGTTRGKTIVDLVRSGGNRFEEFERALLTVGEESGRLHDALRLLGDFYTKKHQLMLRVKKKLAYPMATGLAACFIAPFPLAFAGRTSAYLASALGAAALLVATSGGLVAAVAARYGRKPPLARARFARALATAIGAGLTIPRAVRLAADASTNPEIRAFVHRQSEKQLSARPMAVSLAGCPHLTPDFMSMLDVAEKTGDFTPLAGLADLYEDGFR